MYVVQSGIDRKTTAQAIANLGSNPSPGAFAPFSPSSQSGLKAWFSFNDYKSLTLSTSTVAAIADKSGFANNAVQAGGAKPTWSTSAFNGSAPGATFVSRNLNVVDSASMTNIFAGGGTIAVTFIITSSGSNSTLFYKSTNGGGLSTSGYTLLFYGSGNAVTMRFTAGASTTAGVWDSSITIPINVPYSATISYNTGAMTTAPVIILNGKRIPMTATQAPVGSAGTDSGANMIIGNNTDGGLQPFLGTIGQFAVYNASISASYLTRLRAYFAGLSNINNAHTIVQIGQSNSVGNASVNSTEYVAANANPKFNQSLIYDGNTFSPLSAGNNNQALDAGSFGPEISFTAQYASLIGTPVYLIKYAVGGTSLAVNWAPTSGAQWIAMRAVIDAAVNNLSLSGNNVIINGAMWTQGETDAQNLTNANNYQTNLAAFIAAFNAAALGDYAVSPNYVFAISGLPTQSQATIPFQKTVRDAQIAVGASAGNKYIDTTSLTLNADNIHLDAQGEIDLGKLFSSNINTSFPRYVNGFNQFQQTVTSVAITGSNGVSATNASSSYTPSFTIGLGAITPTSISCGAMTLTAAGNARFILDKGTSTSFNAIDYRTANVSKFFAGTGIYSTDDTNWDIGNGSVSILRAVSAGRVLVNGTTDNGSSTFQVNGTATVSGAMGVGGVAAASALLDAASTTQGFLPPRMTTTQKNAISSPASGLIVYDTTLGKLCVRGAASWETITSV
jgi:hypothetical protein